MAGLVITTSAQAVYQYLCPIENVASAGLLFQGDGLHRRFVEEDLLGEDAARTVRTDNDRLEFAILVDLYRAFILDAGDRRIATVYRIIDISFTQLRQGYVECSVLRIGGQGGVNIEDMLSVIISQAIVKLCHAGHTGQERLIIFLGRIAPLDIGYGVDTGHDHVFYL